MNFLRETKGSQRIEMELDSDDENLAVLSISYLKIREVYSSGDFIVLLV